MFSFILKMPKQRSTSVQINMFFKEVLHLSFRSHMQIFSQLRLVQFLCLKSEDFMAANASCQNYLKSAEYVEVGLSVFPLFCMITCNLTDRD